MYSYIEQLQILKGVSMDSLLKQVENFSVGKCLKKINYYTHDNEKITDNHEAYIYYTTPTSPTIQLKAEIVDNTIQLTLNINSNILLTLSEVVVYYNTTGIFNRFNEKVIFDNKYGTQYKTIYNIDVEEGYYIKPYITTCLGIQKGNIVTVNIVEDWLVDTYSIILLDTYNELITVVEL
jgi:hypothetical protein